MSDYGTRLKISFIGTTYGVKTKTYSIAVNNWSDIPDKRLGDLHREIWIELTKHGSTIIEGGLGNKKITLWNVFPFHPNTENKARNEVYADIGLDEAIQRFKPDLF